jgi:hypothetical protein
MMHGNYSEMSLGSTFTSKLSLLQREKACLQLKLKMMKGLHIK